MNKITLIIELFRNMGARYVLFRIWYAIQTKTGLLKRKFPTKIAHFSFPSLEEWRGSSYPFVTDFTKVTKFSLSDNEIRELDHSVQRILNGEILFFSHEWKPVNDWWRHPVSGYTYPKNHFTQINDFSEEIGDIKYVWEKARFTFLYTLIRHEKQSSIDHSEFVFSSIEDFIDQNPINIGPNYKCSQEMSLRVFNWSFALFFYKDSAALSNIRYKKIIESISGHYQHIYANINFSRIAVRNNHAISETLALYMIGKWFPFIPKSKSFSAKGKKWFEQEIVYQIYPDGGFLQYSHNYHRVVIQLLTWGYLTAEASNDVFSEIVNERAKKSLTFLKTLCQSENGWLPNYGQNDGALFFPLNQNHYRDYRPQLSALSQILGMSDNYFFGEDSNWYGVNDSTRVKLKTKKIGSSKFETMGQYVFREDNCLTVVNNPSYHNRPAQSDQMHLDIHVAGKNVFFDPGTYKYNTSKSLINYYFGTRGHNTVQIGERNQMQKGNRFIWLNWINETENNVIETDLSYTYNGSFVGFKSIGSSIEVKRTVEKQKNQLRWVVTDEVIGDVKNKKMHVHWNIMNDFRCFVQITSTDSEGMYLPPKMIGGWNSIFYGEKREFEQLEFTSYGKKIITEIIIDENIIDTPILP